MTTISTHPVSPQPAAVKEVKRIAWIVHSPTPYKTPFFRMLAKQAQVDVTFLFLYWGDPQRAWELDDLPGVKYKVLPGISFRKRPGQSELVHSGTAVVGELRKGCFDLVVICGYSHPTLLFALFYCFVTGTPFVLQGESHVVQPRHPLKRALKRCLLFPLLRHARAAFATGRKSADYWAEIGIPREQVFTLSNTPDLEFFQSKSDAARNTRESVRKSLGLSSRRAGLFVGRFVEEKGVEIILEAMAGLAPEKQPQLLLVGDGPLRLNYDKIIQHHNLPVRIIDFQQKSQLPELYAAADFFILPSLTEPWGVVVNEAMACRLPLLLSDQVGAAYDLLKEGCNGFMVPAGNTAAWRKALIAMTEITDTELKRMGAASREIVCPWNHEANVKNVLACISQVLQKTESGNLQSADH
jgi:glycosyltransferase involved in cell wall biosynthesis